MSRSFDANNASAEAGLSPLMNGNSVDDDHSYGESNSSSLAGMLFNRHRGESPQQGSKERR